MGDMNEYTEDTLRATVQAAELAIRDSEERGRLLAEMWQGLGLAADAGELLFQAPER
ncbi:LcrG family type III secretion system chaperone PcrG, partial [Pseudomonas aeruginosa]|nr:LcrG family type III secretion system chaperone PcrG [Pseudomonas aeruginosa]